MQILCPGSGMSVAVAVSGGSGTICAHGTIDDPKVFEVRARVYDPTATPVVGDAPSATLATISGNEWCARSVPCSAGTTSPGVSLKLAAFFISATGTSIVTQLFDGLASTVGGTDCCQSGLCGSSRPPLVPVTPGG